MQFINKGDIVRVTREIRMVPYAPIKQGEVGIVEYVDRGREVHIRLSKTHKDLVREFGDNTLVVSCLDPDYEDIVGKIEVMADGDEDDIAYRKLIPPSVYEPRTNGSIRAQAFRLLAPIAITMAAMSGECTAQTSSFMEELQDPQVVQAPAISGKAN
jgi:hypothetical protein